MTTSITIAFIADRVSRFGFENKTEKELSKVIMHPTDLQCIGDSEAGARWFIKNHRGASRVKNTVFNRTDQINSPRVAELNAEIISTAKRVIDGGCSWTDAYLPHEEEAINALRSSLKKTPKGKYLSHKIETSIPMIQVLIIEYDTDNVCALIGWGIVGSTKSRVYLTRDRSAFDYFEDYFDKIVSSSLPIRPNQNASPNIGPHPLGGPAAG